MAPDVFVIRIIVAAAFAITACGAAAAWVSANALKRVAGLAVALTGAIVALAALGAPTALIVAAAAIAFVFLAVGVALVVRLQEAYGAIEAPELDQADRQAESERRGP